METATNLTSPSNYMNMLPVYEHDLAKAEQEVIRLRKMIGLIKKTNSKKVPVKLTDFDFKVANLKWRKEIIECLEINNSNGRKAIYTSLEIAECVAQRNKLEFIDRNIKTKISTTLSLMHKDKRVGRVQIPNTNEFYYSVKENFVDKELTILLPELAQAFGFNKIEK